MAFSFDFTKLLHSIVDTLNCFPSISAVEFDSRLLHLLIILLPAENFSTGKSACFDCSLS